ncbi:MAG: TIGR01177 family methyltransferase [Archaeoglobaceae archaeon]|nr:TIGR01177 family methyltransferase [Archaeoglobaceae archaeon]
MTKFLFYLSGENEDLAKAEVEALISCYSKFQKIEEDRQILVCDGYGNFNRLALTHEICKFIESCEINELEEVFNRIEFPKEYLCIRITNIGRKKLDAAKAERRLGAILWRRGAKISVSNPKIVIRVYLSNKAFIGFLIHKTNKKQFLMRKPNNKPFFMPNVVLPRFARALVNLSGVKEKETMLDPMCGTGTFLIEAGLMGIKFIGIEPFKKIVNGCKKNLIFYGLNPNVIKGDAKKMPIKSNSIDSIVTDFPYLRSTKCYGDLMDLYSKAIEEFSRVLKPKKYAIVVTNTDIDYLLNKRFKIRNKFYQRVHRSLTRRIYVCTN